MIRKRRTQIIATTVALLMLGGVMVIDSGDDHDEAPLPLTPESSLGEVAREAPQRRLDYGQGYESRHGHLAADQTDLPNHRSEEISP